MLMLLGSKLFVCSSKMFSVKKNESLVGEGCRMECQEHVSEGAELIRKDRFYGKTPCLLDICVYCQLLFLRHCGCFGECCWSDGWKFLNKSNQLKNCLED